MVYTKQEDKTAPARVGKHTCERLTVACGDSLGPIYNIHSYHRPTQDQSSRSESPESIVVQHLVARCLVPLLRTPSRREPVGHFQGGVYDGIANTQTNKCLL